MEGVAWVGIVAVVLLIAGWRRLAGVPATRLWRVVAALFGIWALGSHLDVFGANVGLVLPGILLRFVPLVSNARIPGRAMVVVALAVAMLLALTLARAAPGWSHRRRVLVVALMLLDCATAPLPLYRPESSSIYSRLSRLSGPGAVLELPLGVRDGLGEIGRFDARTMYFQTISGRPILGGFVARLSDRVKEWYRQAPVVSTVLHLSDPTCPAAWTPPDVSPAQAYEALARISVRYVVLNRNAASPGMIGYVSSLPLKRLAEEGGRELYELRKW